MAVDILRKSMIRPPALPPVAPFSGHGYRYELVNGLHVEKALEGLEHGRMTSRLARLIGNYAEAWALGETTGADTGYLLSQTTEGPQIIYAPDIGFISAGRVGKLGQRQGFVPCAPDLAVEVISSADRAADLEARTLYYLDAGTTQVWTVYPDTCSVMVHAQNSTHRLGLTDVLVGSDILPGFAVSLSLLFRVDQPAANSML